MTAPLTREGRIVYAVTVFILRMLGFSLLFWVLGISGIGYAVAFGVGLGLVTADFS